METRNQQDNSRVTKRKFEASDKIITCKPPKWNSACRQHEDEQRQGKKREKLQSKTNLTPMISSVAFML
jgi:hypothetical protein